MKQLLYADEWVCRCTGSREALVLHVSERCPVCQDDCGDEAVGPPASSPKDAGGPHSRSTVRDQGDSPHKVARST